MANIISSHDHYMTICKISTTVYVSVKWTGIGISNLYPAECNMHTCYILTIS